MEYKIALTQEMSYYWDHPKRSLYVMFMWHNMWQEPLFKHPHIHFMSCFSLNNLISCHPPTSIIPHNRTCLRRRGCVLSVLIKCMFIKNINSVIYICLFCYVNNWTQELIQSETHQVLTIKGKESKMQLHSHKKQQLASRDGSSYLKRWQLCYPNLTEYIIYLNLHNYSKKKICTEHL